jgi:formate--tetrahydrofolate ligase
MRELASAVVESADAGAGKFKPLYSWDITTEEKIETIAREIYGADGVEYLPKAREGLKIIKQLGFDRFPVCMAKTQKSFSDDETKIGAPTGFKIKVREFEFACGAGFVIPILGEMMRMPGLPNVPASEGIDIDQQGRVIGLS